MKSILIQLDEDTFSSLENVAPAAKRQRAEFIRSAVRRAIRDAEYQRIKKAYRQQPDSEAEADDWPESEAFAN